MGVNLTTLKYFYDSVREHPKLTKSDSFSNLNLCLLGNLYLRKDTKRFLKKNKISKFKVAVEYFNYIGFKTFSIDLNGKDKAIPFDLSKPLYYNCFINKFDVLLNGGTIEHVLDQYSCFENIHNICKKDAVIINVSPEIGSWKRHCPYHYTIEFFDELVKLNRYKKINSKIVNMSGKLRGNLIYIAWIKEEDKPFIQRNIFERMYKELVYDRIL